ncbi:hypothetical protein [Paenibacillus phytohabitans]|uniref:hypothetical protein n=1 Tax=Paenibacillus phytohabitans TaxID=2654978 RepID=UPI00300B94FE
MNIVVLYTRSAKYYARIEVNSDIKDFVSVYPKYYSIYMQWLNEEIQGNSQQSIALSDEIYQLMRALEWN